MCGLFFFYFRKDWCSDAEMAYHCGDRGLDGCCSDEDQVHRASLAWKNDNMWTDLDEDREQERMGYKNKISSDQETGNGIYNNTVMVKKEILKPLFTALLQLQSCSAFLPRTELSWEGQSHDTSYLPRKDELLYAVDINLLPTKNGYILQEDRKEA